MYNVFDIAGYIVQYSNLRKISVCNLKLQKLLYFVQAQFLVDFNEPCFDDEFEAWDTGPVIPSVYKKYRKYGVSHIPWFEEMGPDYRYCIASSDRERIETVVDSCKDFSATKLTEITLQQDPWKSAVIGRGADSVISKSSIRNFFL